MLLKRLTIFSDNSIYDLAVRSSCTLEDDYTNSMAGHFESFLGLMSVNDILMNIKKVIAGLQKTTDKDGKMGIVIQNRINADFSGVLFTSDPFSYSSTTIIQEVFDPLYTGVVQRISEGYIKVI
ncbi:MAG: hypothetical protein FWE69_04085 [Clostridiales bacterium]|nr:hypothetical protein [Clostridiales bacterium]